MCELLLVSYTFTYSMVQSPSWEANWFAASQEIPAFYGTRRYINAITSLRHLSLSWASPIQVGESFTSGLFCLQRKLPACEGFLTGLFHRKGLLAPCPSLKLEDHPLSAVHDCLFNLFEATLHIRGRSSIRNLRTHHAMVTGTHYHGSYTNNKVKIITIEMCVVISIVCY